LQMGDAASAADQPEFDVVGIADWRVPDTESTRF
jgi:hypothetical protein